MTKPLFSRSGKKFNPNKPSTGLNISNYDDLEQFVPSLKKADNIYLGSLDNNLTNQHIYNLHTRVFSLFNPEWKMNKRDALATALGQGNPDTINSILQATAMAYKIHVVQDKIGDIQLTEEKHAKLMAFYAYSSHLMNKLQMQYLYDMDFSDRKEVLKECINFGDYHMEEAIKKMMKDGKIISILKEAEDTYADVVKVADKYSIRLGDGKHFVASDDILITFRDPSDNPAWATWFMKAVPLNDIPDRAKLILLPENERAKHYPKEIPDRPIICHASLWQLGQCSGVLLTTSWNHISVCYRWKIDKPIEVASILFKAVSSPCHLIRNFGYAPQMRVPGEDWF